MTETYQLNSFSILSVESSVSPATEMLAAAKKSLGFVPNMYGNMANLPGLLSTYLEGYSQFRSDSGFSPIEQEVVFLTISRENGCGYCQAAHSMIAKVVDKAPETVVKALRNGSTIPDPKLDALAVFVRHLLESRGRPGKAETETFLAAGFKEKHILAIILAVSVKTISNYANHLFRPPVDEAFADFA